MCKTPLYQIFSSLGHLNDLLLHNMVTLNDFPLQAAIFYKSLLPLLLAILMF